MQWLDIASVFALYVLLDFAWAAYVSAVARGAVGPASAWSAMTVLIGGAGLYLIVSHSPWLLVPAAAGAAFGTVVAMKTK